MKLAWKIYFWIYTLVNLAVIIGDAYLLMSGEKVYPREISTHILTVVTLIALYGFSYRKEIFSHAIRKAIFIVNVLVMFIFPVQYFRMSPEERSTYSEIFEYIGIVEVIFGLVALVIYVPVYFALFKYAYPRTMRATPEKLKGESINL